VFKTSFTYKNNEYDVVDKVYERARVVGVRVIVIDGEVSSI